VLANALQVVARLERGCAVLAEGLDFSRGVGPPAFGAFKVSEKGIFHMGKQKRDAMKIASLCNVFYLAISVERVSRMTVTRI
jgi:hypothetical protein